MKIKIEPGRIVGSCDFHGDGQLREVIGFIKIMGEWTVGMSTCFPSDIKRSKQVLYCYNETMRVLNQVMRDEKKNETSVLQSKTIYI